jgi:phage gp36-like protein
MPTYFSRADLLAALSHDSQAKLTTDTARRWVVGTGDGVRTTWNTPFVEVTSIKGYLNGDVVTAPAPTLSRGTGTGERDQIILGAPPPVGTVVSVTVDAGAKNADVLDKVCASVSSFLSGYVRANEPISDTGLLETLKDKGLLVATVRLRGRRNLDVVDPVEMEYRAAIRWLEDVARGDIVLNLSESDSELEAEAEALTGSEPAVFGPPNDPTGDW